MKVYSKLLDILDRSGAGFFILLDPDNASPEELVEKAALCQEAGVDALLIGGSLMLRDGFSEAVATVKRNCNLPLIIFPGGPGQLSPEADAILFLSLISGRNPQRLIGDHVVAAPAVKRLGLETIPTGYILISSSTTTAVEYMSNTRPIPRDKSGLAASTALAGQYLGMKMIYLEAGSGADGSVPGKLIVAVRSWLDVPLIVGGGIRSPEEAAEKVKAGADFVVVGTAFEKEMTSVLIKDFCKAVHGIGLSRVQS